MINKISYIEKIDEEIKEIAAPLIKKAQEGGLGERASSFMCGEGIIPSAYCEASLSRRGFRLDHDYSHDLSFDISEESLIKKLGKKTITIDVKVKKCGIYKDPVKNNYQASIVSYLNEKVYVKDKVKPDLYAFYRYYPSEEKIVFIGFMPSDFFDINCIFLIRGELEGDNGYHVKKDCFNIPYNLCFGRFYEAIMWNEKEKLNIKKLMVNNYNNFVDKINNFDYDENYKVKKNKKWKNIRKPNIVKEECLSMLKAFKMKIDIFYS